MATIQVRTISHEKNICTIDLFLRWLGLHQFGIDEYQ